jgi:hypothetical protein
LIESKIGRTVAITGIVIIAVSISWLAFSNHYYNKGWAAAIAAIAAQDRKAVDAKDKAIETVRACRDSGGTWDVVNGVCG